MTTATLRREYTFEAAHRLPYVPEGHKCGNVHGHSYRVTVFVRGPINSMGWVVDFGDVDAVARPVIARLDHTNLNALLPNPTSELLCAWLLRQLRAVPHLYAVSVSETERSMAMVTVDDLDAAAREPTARPDERDDGRPFARSYLGSRGIARAEELAAADVVAAVTVGAWVDSWCEGQGYSEAKRDRARAAAYLPRTALHLLPLAAVTPQAIAAWVEELRQLPSPKTGRTASSSTVRNVYDVVRRALRRAVFDGKLLADPFAVLPSELRPTVTAADPTARESYRFRREEVEALVASAEGRWRVLWCLLALTGARLGEALALRWRDLVEDEPLRRVVLSRQVHHTGRDLRPTKTGDVRVVPEHPELRRVLEAWRGAGWPEEYGRKPTAEDLIVPGRSEPGRPWGTAEDAGGPLWSQAVDRAFKRQLAALGQRAHRVHDLRHTFASLCADAGMRENVAARWTHKPGGSSARHLYSVPSWAAQCAEMKLLVVNFEPPPVVGARTATGG